MITLRYFITAGILFHQVNFEAMTIMKGLQAYDLNLSLEIKSRKSRFVTAAMLRTQYQKNHSVFDQPLQLLKQYQMLSAEWFPSHPQYPIKVLLFLEYS